MKLTVKPHMQKSYSSSEFASALGKVGIVEGDTVFFHVCLETLGIMQAVGSKTQLWETLLLCLRNAVGATGTILVPTYTFSFCRQEIYDVQKTPMLAGPWSTSTEFVEFFRQQPEAVRSLDPIHSVAALGFKAKELLSGLTNTCFGDGSIHQRLLQHGGKVCMIGVGFQEATFQHHVEEKVGVPFRFRKLFTGYIRESSKPIKTGWIYNVHILAANGEPEGHRLDAVCRSSGKCRAATVGSGEILCISCSDMAEILTAELQRDPWFLVKGPAVDPVAAEELRIGEPKSDVALPPRASLSQMIQELWRLPRHIVSEGYDAALRALATQVPMTVHEYPTGTECWSWIIPEKWTCHEAYLETMDGRRLFSYADNPLHVVSYSLPFDGEVSRNQLFEHLHTHPRIPQAVPFIFKYYERDWGLCCSKELKDTLLDERYRVVIKSAFSFGKLKVGEVIAAGKSEETIVLCAHLCHPAMVNDDLSGVVVGIKVMQELLARRDLRYTYRFVIVPETIGSVAYLSQNKELIPKMKGGLFLEMLGLRYPHDLQLSFDGTTEVDLCFSLALKTHDPHGWIGVYRTVIGNDERQYNGPGVRVPMLSLSRVLPGKHADAPYLEYHSSHDTPEMTSIRNLEDSCNLALKMIDTIENNRVPLNRFKGEVFCSRYGMFIDSYVNPDGHRVLFNVMDLIDGTRSIAQIANSCGISFEATKNIVDELQVRGLTV